MALRIEDENAHGFTLVNRPSWWPAVFVGMMALATFLIFWSGLTLETLRCSGEDCEVRRGEVFSTTEVVRFKREGLGAPEMVSRSSKSSTLYNLRFQAGDYGFVSFHNPSWGGWESVEADVRRIEAYKA